MQTIDHVFDGKTGREIARENLKRWAAQIEVERRLDRVIADMRKEPLGYWGDDPGYWGNDVHNNFMRAKALDMREAVQMSEMIEKLTDVISEACDHALPPWMLEKVARAAIKAMSDPTNDMKHCSDDVHWDYSCNMCGGLAEGWHKMHEAALK